MSFQNCVVNVSDHPSYSTHCLFYFLYYACLGLFRPFLPSFLDSVGLDSRQIGNVFVLISLATMVSAPSWGSGADRFGLKSKFLIGFPLLAAVIMTPLILSPGYYQAILIALVQGALIVPLIPLADSVCIERCKEFGWKYGRIRLWGTIGFLMTSSVGGFVAESVGWTPVMFLMLSIVCLMAIGGFRLRASSPLKIGKKLNFQSQNAHVQSRRVLVLRPFVLFFLIGTVLYQTAFGTYNLFFGINLEQTTHAPKWISVAWVIATLSEIAFFGMVDSLIKRIGPLKMMGLAIMCGSIRWALLSQTSFLPLILASQILHGVMLGGFVAGAVTFSSNIFPSTLKTFAQGLHNAAYNGLGGAIAALACSYVFFEGGVAAVFRFSSVIAVASMGCLLACALLYRKLSLALTNRIPNAAS